MLIDEMFEKLTSSTRGRTWEIVWVSDLGNYHLTRFLGEGSFAEVYLCEHRYLKHLAAIKVLRTFLPDEYKADFVAEAQHLVRLRHTNIIRLLEFGIEGDVPFLIMEYAPHGTLRTRHPKGS